MAELSLSKGGIQSIRRALAILALFKENKELGITQIANALSLAKGTVHGLVKTLESCGYLEQNPHNQKYSYGIEVFKIGLTFASRMDLREVATGHARKLCDDLDETVFIAVLLGGMCVIVDRYSPNRPFILVPQIGSSIPAHCTAIGKVLLAGITEIQLEKVIKTVGLASYTANTIVDLKKLKEVLEEVREKGYNVTHQEALLGLSCVAAPIRNHSGQVVAAISVSASTDSISSNKRLSKIIAKVISAAQDISTAMGFEHAVGLHSS